MVFSLILFAGCNSGPVCKKPYILVGNDCCLDQNDNGVCDSDEITTTTLPTITTTTILKKPYMQIFDHYNDKILNCTYDATLYYTTNQYEEGKSKIMECRKVVSNGLIEANKLVRDSATPKDEVKAFMLDLDRCDKILTAIYLALSLSDTTSDEEKIQLIAQVENALRDSLYCVYKMENQYPHTRYYERFYETQKEEVDEEIKSIVDIHNQFNQVVNEYYDAEYGLEAKYFYQVNPNDPIIIDITDNLVEDILDQEEIKWKLFEFVRENVQYKYDPNWRTDWVQQPAITLLYGKGDCEDHSVLLASMFMRAGISDVGLCYVDTNGDTTYDHMLLYVGNIGWDATCKDCDDSAPAGIRNCRKECFDVNEVVMNPGITKRRKELEAGWELCYNDLNREYEELTRFYTRKIAGRDLSYKQSSERYEQYSQKFNEFIAIMNSCNSFIKANKQELEEMGYNANELLQFMDEVYDAQKTVLDEWAENLKNPCPEGYIFGIDYLCHEPCGTSYCIEGTVCCKGRCYVSCPSGYYLATDCRCYPY